ncbi:MAG: glycosyltransferase [Chloroflexi bacterium]|nr:glycosyltransferase [Chloroflexota bacterium]
MMASNMSDKLLTIITVTRNCARTIERTLKSVAPVKSDDVEYIVVDGVSYDGTLEILEKYSGMIDRFICEPDTGIYNAMNKGIAASRGRFVLFINGDDELIPDGVKKVLSILPDCREQIVCAATLVAGSETTPPFSYAPVPKRLMFGDSLPHPSSFIDRQLLSRFPYREDLKIASDFDFFLRAFLAGASFRIVPYLSALHHPGGVSSNHKRRKNEVCLVLRDRLGWQRMLYYQAIHVFIRGMRKIAAWFGMKTS